jgi:hypothetical protein
MTMFVVKFASCNNLNLYLHIYLHISNGMVEVGFGMKPAPVLALLAVLAQIDIGAHNPNTEPVYAGKGESMQDHLGKCVQG